MQNPAHYGAGRQDGKDLLHEPLSLSLFMRLKGGSQGRREINPAAPQRIDMPLAGLILPVTNRLCVDEASPVEIDKIDNKNQKRTGYRVGGKNGFIKEYGSDQSTW
jgi:hypothetical protein